MGRVKLKNLAVPLASRLQLWLNYAFESSLLTISSFLIIQLCDFFLRPRKDLLFLLLEYGAWFGYMIYIKFSVTIRDVYLILIVCCSYVSFGLKKTIKKRSKPFTSFLTQGEDPYTYADPNVGRSPPTQRCDTYSYVTIKPDAAAAMAAGSEYASISRPKQWEVPKRNVRLDKKLGSGHFGQVMKGYLKTKRGIQVVAVKMLKGLYAYLRLDWFSLA